MTACKLCNLQEQVNELRRAIEETNRELEKVQQRRLHTEEEIIKRYTAHLL